MKLLFLLSFFITFLLSNEVSCKYSLKANSLYNFSKLANSSILSVVGEVEYGLIVGDLDPANSPIVYYDNNSAICGGKLDKNIIVSAYCPYDIEGCFDINLGTSGLSLITKIDNLYTNNVTVANGYPCLPKNVSNISVAFYAYESDNRKDIGYGNLKLLAIDEETEIPLEKEEARIQREKCSGLIKYIDEWEELLDSQNVSTKKILTTLETKDNKDEDELNIIAEKFISDNDESLDLDTFETNIKTTITDSFLNYSNVFGLGSYGSVPTPITFSLLGKTYTPLDFSKYENFVSICRTSFALFAYVWGFILFIRDFT